VCGFAVSLPPPKVIGCHSGQPFLYFNRTKAVAGTSCGGRLADPIRALPPGISGDVGAQHFRHLPLPEAVCGRCVFGEARRKT